MTDARSIHDDLADVATQMQHASSAEATMQRVAEAAQQLVKGCASASVSTVARHELLVTRAASDPVATRGDELQVEHREGPCIDAAWDDLVVVSPDLASDPRWPDWSARVVAELGVVSMLCVRLSTADRRLGALNLYGQEVGAFDQEDVDLARALAAHSSVAIAQASKVEHLEVALDTRTAIGQAVGVIMVQHRLESQAAFQVLLRLSSHQNRKLAAVARDLVESHDAEARSQARLSATITDSGAAPTPGPRPRVARTTRPSDDPTVA